MTVLHLACTVYDGYWARLRPFGINQIISIRFSFRYFFWGVMADGALCPASRAPHAPRSFRAAATAFARNGRRLNRTTDGQAPEVPGTFFLLTPTGVPLGGHASG